MRAGQGRTPAPGWGLRDGAGRGTPVQSRPARGCSTCDTGRPGTHRRERQASQGPGAGGSGGPRAGGDPARAGAALGWGRKLSWSAQRPEWGSVSLTFGVSLSLCAPGGRVAPV